MRVTVLGIVALLLIVASCTCAKFHPLKPMKAHQLKAHKDPAVNLWCPGKFEWRRLDVVRWTMDCTDLINPYLVCPGRFKWSNVDGNGWTKVCLKKYDWLVEVFCPAKFTWARMDDGVLVKDCVGVWKNEIECPGRFRYANTNFNWQVWTKECLDGEPNPFWGHCASSVRWDYLDNGVVLRQCIQNERKRPICNGRWRWASEKGKWAQSCKPFPVGYIARFCFWLWTWQLPFGTPEPAPIYVGSQTEKLTYSMLKFLNLGTKLVLQVNGVGYMLIRINPDQKKTTADVTIQPSESVTAWQQQSIDQLEDELNDSPDLYGFSVTSDLTFQPWPWWNQLEWFTNFTTILNSGRPVGIYIQPSGLFDVREDKTATGKVYSIYYDPASDSQTSTYNQIQEFLRIRAYLPFNKIQQTASVDSQWYKDLLALLSAGKGGEIDIDKNGVVSIKQIPIVKGQNPWIFSKGLIEDGDEDKTIRGAIYKKLQEFLLAQKDIQKYTPAPIVTQKPKPAANLGEIQWLDSLEKKMKEKKDVFIIIDDDAKTILRDDPKDNKDGIASIILYFTTQSRSEKQIIGYQRIQRLLNSRPHLKPLVKESTKPSKLSSVRMGGTYPRWKL